MAAKKGIDTATVFGLIVGIGSLLSAMVLEFNELNPDLGSPFLQASALLIIFGGTLGCTMTSFPMEVVMRLPTYLKIALFQDKTDPKEMISTVVKLAEMARRDGIISLEPRCAELQQTYPFLALGFQYVIDGRPTETVKEILTDEVYSMEERHKLGVGIFNSMGGYAPTMGIVGTVVGLIAALSKAGEGGESSEVVGAIATAFIATFFGIGSANLILLPLGSKLQAKSAEEVFMKLVQTEAILSVQNGENPRALEASLRVFFRREPTK